MKKRIALALVISMGLCSVQAQAKDEGFYIGGSLGLVTVQQSGTDPEWGYFEIDDSDYAYKFIAGYQFSPVFAVEGSYRDLGKTSSNTARTDLQGLDVFGVAGIPLGPVRVFGKLGGIYWDDSVSGSDDDGFDGALGVGLEFSLFSLALRAEVEYFSALDDVYLATVGATFTF